MKYLSWMFFCLSPFVLFCSENGAGLILCPVFIALGFIFKNAGNNAGGGRTIVEIEPQKFWEWHYKDRMRNSLAQKDTIRAELMALNDQEARRWATSICGYHNAPVPSEGVQEQIARANGVVTETMIKERNKKKDRIQVGKYILMNELKNKCDKIKVKDSLRRRYYYPAMRIKKDIDKINSSNNRGITEYWAHDKYKKTIKEIWNSLSEEEKKQAAIWVEEYKSQLINVMREYLEGKRHDDNIEMDF